MILGAVVVLTVEEDNSSCFEEGEEECEEEKAEDKEDKDKKDEE